MKNSQFQVCWHMWNIQLQLLLVWIKFNSKCNILTWESKFIWWWSWKRRHRKSWGCERSLREIDIFLYHLQLHTRLEKDDQISSAVVSIFWIQIFPSYLKETRTQQLQCVHEKNRFTLHFKLTLFLRVFLPLSLLHSCLFIQD